MVALQAFAVSTGVGQDLFGTVGLSPSHWAVAIGVSASVVLLEELEKTVARLASKRLTGQTRPAIST